MRERLGEPALIEAFDYGVPFELGEVRVSLHPSGHMLGAAQVRMEHAGRVTVVSGDYKREPDPTIVGIVAGWPRDFVTERAIKLGFTTAEKTFDDIIRIHIEDELGGNFVN